MNSHVSIQLEKVSDIKPLFNSHVEYGSEIFLKLLVFFLCSVNVWGGYVQAPLSESPCDVL